MGFATVKCSRVSQPSLFNQLCVSRSYIANRDQCNCVVTIRPHSFCSLSTNFKITHTYRQGKHIDTSLELRQHQHIPSITYNSDLCIRPRSLIISNTHCVYHLQLIAPRTPYTIYTDEGRDLRFLPEEDLPVSYQAVACSSSHGLQPFQQLSQICNDTQNQQHRHTIHERICTTMLSRFEWTLVSDMQRISGGLKEGTGGPDSKGVSTECIR